jgi:hypothetical protein
MMPYCYKCGVKLENGARVCPLCGTIIPEDTLKEGFSEKIKNKTDQSICIDTNNIKDQDKNNIEENNKNNSATYPYYSSLSRSKKHLVIFEILSVSLLIVVASLLVINLILDSTISWSKLPSITIFLCWFISMVVIFFLKKPALIGLFTTIAISLYLVGLDSLDLQIDWSIRIAIPIVIISSIVGFFITTVTIRSKLKGLNIAAYFLLGSCLICITIDTTLSLNLIKIIRLSWSKYVCFAVIPVSIFFLYIHNRFSKKFPGKRIFRM